MKATELTKLIDKEGDWTTGTLKIRVKVVDARLSYGRLDLRIKPLHGSGEQWVKSAAVKFDKK